MCLWSTIPVARLLANGNFTHERQLIDYAKAACVPAYAYNILQRKIRQRSQAHCYSLQVGTLPFSLKSE